MLHLRVNGPVRPSMLSARSGNFRQTRAKCNEKRDAALIPHSRNSPEPGECARQMRGRCELRTSGLARMAKSFERTERPFLTARDRTSLQVSGYGVYQDCALLRVRRLRYANDLVGAFAEK
jgi:hypothetical protein